MGKPRGKVALVDTHTTDTTDTTDDDATAPRPECAFHERGPTHVGNVWESVLSSTTPDVTKAPIRQGAIGGGRERSPGRTHTHTHTHTTRHDTTRAHTRVRTPEPARRARMRHHTIGGRPRNDTGSPRGGDFELISPPQFVF